MNKTRKRAIEKHRAKALKYDARRKDAGADGSGSSGAAAMSRLRSATQAAVPARSRSAARSAAEEAEVEAVEAAE